MFEPETAVVRGATKLAYSLAKNLKYLAIDVIPFSFSFISGNGKTIVISKKNSSVNKKFSQIFSNFKSNQKQIVIQIFEMDCSENKKILGKFILPIPQASVGQSNVCVIFEINENGILKLGWN